MEYEGRKVEIAFGYPVIWVAGRWVAVHILVWEKVNGPKPRGYDIHHKNKNKLDWEVGNLELLTKKDHARLHHGWVRQNGIWTHKPCCKCKKILALKEFHTSPKHGGTFRPECKMCQKEYASEWNAKNPSKRKIIQQKNWASHGKEYYERSRSNKRD